MKKQLLGCLSAIVFTLALVLPAVAGSLTGFRFRVEIPFAFQIGESTLAAGRYQVEQMANPSVLIIRNLETQQAVKFTGQSGVRRGLSQVQMNFQRINDQTFLAEIIDGYNEYSYKLTPSAKERQALKIAQAQTQKPELISLVLKFR